MAYVIIHRLFDIITIQLPIGTQLFIQNKDFLLAMAKKGTEVSVTALQTVNIRTNRKGQVRVSSSTLDLFVLQNQGNENGIVSSFMSWINANVSAKAVPMITMPMTTDKFTSG